MEESSDHAVFAFFSAGEQDGDASSSKDSKELFILRKTLAELELRIETQKRTLAARDESVRRLLEMLQVGILKWSV